MVAARGWRRALARGIRTITFAVIVVGIGISPATAWGGPAGAEGTHDTTVVMLPEPATLLFIGVAAPMLFRRRLLRRLPNARWTALKHEDTPAASASP